MIHALIYSSIKWFIHWLINSFIVSSIDWLIHSLIHPFIDSSIDWFSHWLTHPLIYSSIDWFIHWLIYPLIDLLFQIKMRQNESIPHLFPARLLDICEARVLRQENNWCWGLPCDHRSKWTWALKEILTFSKGLCSTHCREFLLDTMQTHLHL